jgi:hypothetical protein
MRSKRAPESEASGTDTDASATPVAAAELATSDPALTPTDHVGLTDVDTQTRIRDLERRAERHRRIAEDCLDALDDLQQRVEDLETERQEATES